MERNRKRKTVSTYIIDKPSDDVGDDDVLGNKVE